MGEKECRARSLARHKERYNTDPDYRRRFLDRVGRAHKERYWSDDAYRAKKQAEARQAYAKTLQRADGRTMLNLRGRAWRASNPVRAAWIQSRGKAAAAGRVFTLDQRLFNDLVTDSCFYCAAPPNPINGIDRVDNSQGYISENVVTCCTWCNTAKMNRSRADFEGWALRLAWNLQNAGVAIV